jgi:hypothetical protein
MLCVSCVRPGLNTAVRVELMARQVPSRARNVTHDLLVTLLSHSHSSIANVSQLFISVPSMRASSTAIWSQTDAQRPEAQTTNSFGLPGSWCVCVVAATAPCHGASLAMAEPAQAVWSGTRLARTYEEGIIRRHYPIIQDRRFIHRRPSTKQTETLTATSRSVIIY